MISTVMLEALGRYELLRQRRKCGPKMCPPYSSPDAKGKFPADQGRHWHNVRKKMGHSSGLLSPS